MNWCYLSPHLDDALLSCGGMIWEQTQSGQDVLVLTICAGDPPERPLFPFARELHQRWNTGREAPALRRLEDQAACQMVGARWQHWQVPDCIYRSCADDTALIAGEEGLWQPLPPCQLSLAEALAARIASEIDPDTQLVCPAAVGEHIDHRLVRAAAEKTGRSLLYYRDYPYIAAENPKIIPWLNHMQPAYRQSVSAAGLLAWMDGIRCYDSQLSSFWADDAGLQTAIAEYHAGGGGEALYRRGADAP